MKLIIDIPDTLYESIQACKNIEDTGEVTVEKVLIKAVENGIPLPKGHGRLIDADTLECDGFNRTSDDYAFDCIDNAPTIIGADKVESEEQENDIPWYMQIFNQNILNEYKKRMRDATPEERKSVQDYIDSISKEVPYNDKESSIHSEIYREENNDC